MKFLQATLANVREMKLHLEVLETKDIANFTTALSKAFELLQWVNYFLTPAAINKMLD
jgi:hypothetical protein